MPKRERPVGRWCLAARGLAKDRAHPGPPTPCRVASECMDTPEVERKSRLELASRPWRGRALPVELHPQKMQGMPSASTEAALRQLVKERPPRAVVRSIDRWPRRDVGRLKQKMKKARILSESGPLRTELGGLRELGQFSAPLSRMHLVFHPIKPAMAGRDEQTLGAGSHAIRLGTGHRGKPQGSAHERTQTLRGSVCPDDVAWFHGGCLVEKSLGPNGRGFKVERTVKSLYPSVNPLRQ